MPNVLTITIAYDKVINIYALQDVYNDCFLFYIFKSTWNITVIVIVKVKYKEYYDFRVYFNKITILIIKGPVFNLKFINSLIFLY